ncbi:MAG: prepilin-type N-terminal cleavage/methylation domain-containing protein [Deltaproteobacteria bacterium]|nr:prepilin-type N-terminal cleavage/methylation domain-containing protein [Deltaproteobacteria bacterium]
MNRPEPKYRVPRSAGGHCHSPAGFTLVEILVAMTIFAVAVLGLAIGATSVMRANQTSYFNTVATNLAQDKLEELKATAVASLPSCPSYATSGCSDTRTSLGLTFSRSWQIIANSPTPGVNRLDVKIDWTDYISHSITISSAVRQ